MLNPFKYLYGPVQSWRLGRSMGIDPLSLKHKVCNMDCVYCQLGPTLSQESQNKSPALSDESQRRTFVLTSDILNEVGMLDPDEQFDCLTISGRGEPTLAENLGGIIAGIKAIRKEKIAVITNSSLLWREDVRQELMKADMVLAKLDALDQDSFNRVDRPAAGVSFGDVLQGLWKFRRGYKGYFSLDVMLVETSVDFARGMFVLAKSLEPDHVHLNTPLRDSPVKPLSRYEMALVRTSFEDLPVTTVYDEESGHFLWNDPAIVRRHGRPRHSLT